MISNNRLTISVARELFESQRLKPSELAQYCYSLAERTQSHFNAFSHLFTLEEILEAAVSSDQRYMDGHPKGMLDGIPVSLKCNIAVKDKPWQASSNILNGVIGYESIVSQKLKENGAIFIGSTNMDEFGMGSLGNNCNLGPTINPLPYLMHHASTINDKKSIDNLVQEIKSMTLPKWLSDISVTDEYKYLSPGGSSSGSAASVAIGSSLVSIGTDTGGS
jgi:aspartyl-tRNA(Asn)/glutamyl-tRNA(Gln) amidotransferase subunit A